MSRTTSACFAIAAVVGFLASAQERPAAPGSEQDPAKLTVTSRVYDKNALLRAPALPAEAQRGRALWLQRCAWCHDGVGQPTYKTMGPWLGAETIQSMGADGFRAIVGAGTVLMPAFRYTLQPPQVDDLIAFLNTVLSSQKPTAAQLAGIPVALDNGE